MNIFSKKKEQIITIVCDAWQVSDVKNNFTKIHDSYFYKVEYLDGIKERVKVIFTFEATQRKFYKIWDNVYYSFCKNNYPMFAG